MAPRGENGRLFASGALLSGIVLTEAVTGGLYLIAINRFLGPAEYGLWSYALASYVLAAAIIATGFESVLHFVYGDDEATGDEIVAAAFAWRIALSLAACIGFAAFALWHRSDPVLPSLLLLAVPAIMGRGVAALARSAFVARENVLPIFRISVAFRSAELIAGVALLASGAGLAALMALHGALWLAEAAFGWARLRGSVPLPLIRPTKAATAKLLCLGAPRAVINGALAFMIGAPIILFQPLAGDPGEVGFFALALQLITLAFWSAQAFVNASSPALARRARDGAAAEGPVGVRVALSSVAIFGAIAAALATFGASAFGIIFGQSYAEAAGLVMAACLIGALQLAPNGYQQAMLARRAHAPIIAANALGCVVIAAGFALAPEAVTAFDAICLSAFGWAARAALLFAAAALSSASRGRR